MEAAGLPSAHLGRSRSGGVPPKTLSEIHFGSILGQTVMYMYMYTVHKMKKTLRHETHNCSSLECCNLIYTYVTANF